MWCRYISCSTVTGLICVCIYIFPLIYTNTTQTLIILEAKCVFFSESSGGFVAKGHHASTYPKSSCSSRQKKVLCCLWRSLVLDGWNNHCCVPKTGKVSCCLQGSLSFTIYICITIYIYIYMHIILHNLCLYILHVYASHDTHLNLWSIWSYGILQSWDIFSKWMMYTAWENITSQSVYILTRLRFYDICTWQNGHMWPISPCGYS